MLVPDCRAHLQQHGAGAVDVGDGLWIGFAVLDARHVADANRMTVLFADDDVVEFGRRVCDAPARPQRRPTAAPDPRGRRAISTFCVCSARATSLTVRL